MCCGKGGVGFAYQPCPEVVNVWNFELAPMEQQALLHFPSISAGEVSVLLQGVMFTVHLQDLVNEFKRISVSRFRLRSLLRVRGFVCWSGSGIFKGGDQ